MERSAKSFTKKVPQNGIRKDRQSNPNSLMERRKNSCKWCVMEKAKKKKRNMMD